MSVIPFPKTTEDKELQKAMAEFAEAQALRKRNAEDNLELLLLEAKTLLWKISFMMQEYNISEVEKTIAFNVATPLYEWKISGKVSE